MILLDTHVLIWLDQNTIRLGERAHQITVSALAAGEVAVSAVTFWEASMLVEKGRIRTTLDLARGRDDLLSTGLIEFPVDGATGIFASKLTQLHGDPADRMIMATAIRHDALLVTADERILSWPGALQRQDARQ